MRLVIVLLLTLLTISCIKRPATCTLKPGAQVEIEQRKIHPTATVNCDF
jgi:hypothetical protein